MSLFGHSPCDTAGTGGLAIGWNDQNARCAGVITYGLVADFIGKAAAVAAGKLAPARTHSTRASISSGLSLPPFGIFKSPVCRTARISKLFSGSPGTIAAPDFPPLSNASRESSRRSPYGLSRSTLWQS